MENEILKLKQKKATRQSKFLGFWSTLSSDPKRPKLLQDSPRSESLRPMSTSLTVTTSKAATDQPIPEKIDLTNFHQYLEEIHMGHTNRYLKKVVEVPP